jgi:hypothetical protein
MNSSPMFSQAIAAKFPWRRVRTFADVGSADGDLAVAVASRHPHLRGVGVDCPSLQEQFDARVAYAGLRSRLRFAPGDVRRVPLPRVDVLILRDQAELLGRAYDALPEGGAVIVSEAVGVDRLAAVGFHAAYADGPIVVGLR